ncbi:XRE family transcriptional regulator [Ruminococcus sp. AM34-9LB]|nr:XRE family transcriptional regulator [Ruminococcus sp. AM54-14NS]RHT11249.1 XRE family transcriptional regulator [Ruminococcus sp. AM34-9LB]RHT12167.1 XRE family transcriptional regulator [Ruminococcus sp. AM36-17]
MKGDAKLFDVLEKITSLREERGWTTYRLSKLSGIPQSTISTWYRKNLMPPIDKLEIICQTFGITLAEFFNDTDVLVSMTEEEKNMLSQWNLLTPAQRAAVINIIGLLLSSD